MLSLSACCVPGAEIGARDGDRQGAFYLLIGFFPIHLKSTYCECQALATQNSVKIVQSAFDLQHVCHRDEQEESFYFFMD